MASSGVFGFGGLRLRFVVVFGFTTFVWFLVGFLVVFLRVPLSGIVYTLSQFFQFQHMVNVGMNTN